MATPTSPVTFGVLLRQLRRRAQMTQADLAAAVGYSVSFISSLEQNTRHPDVHSVLQHFVPALALQAEPHLATHLLELAAAAQGDLPPTAALTVTRERRLVITETPPEPSTNLPTPPTPLIGRDQTVKMLCDRLLGHQGRLLTLVGPPGVGKTRLALAVAVKLQPFHPDGVYFVPLAPVSDPALVASALVSTLAIAESVDRPPEKRLIEFLRRKEVLLLLDNFEQVSAAAPLVATLLAECPRIRILVTSRERLHLRAEQRYPVQPLGIADACELFVQRAQAVDPAFALTSENQPIIAAISQRLDCLPLALELSAVQVDLFSPPALLARLQDQPLDLLANGLRDLPAHHRTLRQAIGRSYNLLPEQEKALLRTLGVFVGGFDLKAVVAFGFAQATLQALVNKSLVQVEHHRLNAARFLLLETVREYAREQLEAANELAAICNQHAHYFLNLAEEAVPYYGGSIEREWLDRLTRESDNLRAALDWLIQGDPILGQQMAARLSGFWLAAGLIHEGRHWLAKALAANTTPTLARAWALWASGDLAENQADHLTSQPLITECLMIFQTQGELCGWANALRLLGYTMVNTEQFSQALVYFEQSLGLARQVGNPQLVADALASLGHLFVILGRTPAHILPYLRESAATYRSLGQLEGLAYVLDVEARAQIMLGDYTQAVALEQEALVISQELGAQVGSAWVLNHLGKATWLMGDRAMARTYWKKALQLFQEADVKPGMMDVWLHMGWAEQCLYQNLDQATHYYQQSLALSCEKNHQKVSARCLVGLSRVLLARDAGDHAARLLSVAQKLFDNLPPLLAPADRDEYIRLLDDTRTQLGESAFASAWTAGQAMALDEAIEYALTYHAPNYAAPRCAVNQNVSPLSKPLSVQTSSPACA